MNIQCTQCGKEIEKVSASTTNQKEAICQECSKYRFIEEQIQVKEIIRRIQLSLEGFELLPN